MFWAAGCWPIATESWVDPRPVHVGFVFEWHWDRFLFRYFSFVLSVAFPKCLILIPPYTTDTVSS